MMAKYKDEKRWQEQVKYQTEQSMKLFKNNEVCMFPSPELEIFDGLPRIDVLEGHLRYR